MQDVPSVGNIADSSTDEVAATKLAIDSEVEQRQLSHLLGQLELNANGPDFVEPEWALLADLFVIVPGLSSFC